MVGLVVSAALLTGRTGAVDSYYAVYRNVTGVKFGTQVLYEGYPIGQVEQVTPQERGGRMWFRVDFGVTRGWRIPDDSLAQIAAPGLLAAVAININAGSSKSALKPESEIKAKKDGQVKYTRLKVVTTDKGEKVVLTRNGEILLLDPKGRELEKYEIPAGAILSVEENQEVAAGDVLTLTPGRFQGNLISPLDFNRALAMLYRGELLNEEWTAYLIDKMSRVKPGLNHLLPSGVSDPTATVAHKNGYIDYVPYYVDNDIGIVMFERGGETYAYAMTFWSQDNPWVLSDLALGQTLSRLAWEHFSSVYQ